MSWVGILPLMGCVLIWFLPESPRWCVQQKKHDEAKEALCKLRNSDNVDSELQEIVEEESLQTTETLGIVQVIKRSEFRWPLITSLTLNGIQQLCGINAVSILF